MKIVKSNCQTQIFLSTNEMMQLMRAMESSLPTNVRDQDFKDKLQFHLKAETDEEVYKFGP